MREIPVYLFTGFLGAGKTSFIKETLEHHEFGDDGRTLLLVCENGETQYEPEKFVGPGVRVERIKSEAEATGMIAVIGTRLNKDKLKELFRLS